MKQARGWITAAAVALLAVGLMTDWLAEGIAFLASVPWFVYLIVAAILYSGYKFVTLSKDDYKADQEWIEQEGNVFIRRMEQERDRREKAAVPSDEEDGEMSAEKQYVYDQELDGH
ncbi:MAG TPA: sporulation YhaL family protein [Bacillales bacterium]|nr:sporulation YhaL family protein [Bacillales bacterium]